MYVFILLFGGSWLGFLLIQIFRSLCPGDSGTSVDPIHQWVLLRGRKPDFKDLSLAVEQRRTASLVSGTIVSLSLSLSVRKYM